MESFLNDVTQESLVSQNVYLPSPSLRDVIYERPINILELQFGHVITKILFFQSSLHGFMASRKTDKVLVNKTKQKI